MLHLSSNNKLTQKEGPQINVRNETLKGKNLERLPSQTVETKLEDFEKSGEGYEKSLQSVSVYFVISQS